MIKRVHGLEETARSHIRAPFSAAIAAAFGGRG